MRQFYCVKRWLVRYVQDSLDATLVAKVLGVLGAVVAAAVKHGDKLFAKLANLLKDRAECGTIYVASVQY
jgi:hypothetical protein